MIHDSQAHIQRDIQEWLGSGSINIFGMPGAGKDTQARRLAVMLDAPVISSGEILRSVASTELQADLNSGLLESEASFEELVLPHLKDESFDSKPLILSSVGRRLDEMDAVLEACQQSGHQLKAAILLKINPELARKRVLSSDRHRQDDNIDTLNNRFNEFQDKTQQVVEAYRQRSLLIEVDGSDTADEVFESITQALIKLISKEKS